MQLIDIVTSPWLLPEAKLQELRGIYETHLRGEKIDVKGIEARLGRPLVNSQPHTFDVVNGVAVIGVDGVLAPKANLFTQVSGGASAQVLQAQVEEAAADPSILAILLEVDSPGGSVFGVPELAAAVRAARDAKPVGALVTGLAASGGYWVASAANHVWITSGVAILGSIGVVATHVDVSGRESAMGVKTTEVTAGKFKRITSQYGPLSKEGRADLQARVDAIYEVFVETVAANRGVSVETVLAEMADGRDFVGKQAIEAGLADGVLSKPEAIAALLEEANGGGDPANQSVSRAGAPAAASTQSTEQKMPNEQKPITAEVITAEAPAVAEAFRAEGRAQGAQAERERILAIEAAAMPGYESIVAEAKADGKSTAGDVALRINAAMKAESAQRLEAIRNDAPAPVQSAAAPTAEPKADKPAEPMADASALAAKATAYQAECAAKGERISMAAAMQHVVGQPA